jgi:hypothetical protein
VGPVFAKITCIMYIDRTFYSGLRLKFVALAAIACNTCQRTSCRPVSVRLTYETMCLLPVIEIVCSTSCNAKESEQERGFFDAVTRRQSQF